MWEDETICLTLYRDIWKDTENNDELDSVSFDTICNAAKDRGMSVTCQYETQTENYKYYRVSVSKYRYKTYVIKQVIYIRMSCKM